MIFVCDIYSILFRWFISCLCMIYLYFITCERMRCEIEFITCERMRCEIKILLFHSTCFSRRWWEDSDTFECPRFLRLSNKKIRTKKPTIWFFFLSQEEEEETINFVIIRECLLLRLSRMIVEDKKTHYVVVLFKFFNAFHFLKLWKLNGIKPLEKKTIIALFPTLECFLLKLSSA